MSPAEWERIQTVYHRVSELPVERQEAALDAECGDDPKVLQEVRQLLLASQFEKLDDVVQKVAYDVASQTEERVGPYRLEHELGRGGMGTVYLACRDDNEYTRKVAIKFLNMGMDRPEHLRRFRQERQILADLEHPNIARLLEGGQTGTGQPYLVMEYVDGKPLLQYCRDNQLSRQQTLELVAKVCDAVEYAHTHLVVHRDLKPSNILVTEDGSPKLLDFGIAKVLESRAEDQEPLTQNTGQLLTLDYASPEQISGHPVSTVSDVYSLGVVLYELLAGERPFQTRTTEPLAYCVLYNEPERPSMRARVNRLPSVSSELDNVILKAMAKEPVRRYRSAGALADDIRRHLNGQAVLAYGDSTWYVVSKFVRRNRAATGVAAVLALAVVALGIQLAVANQRLGAERDAAVRERANAREVSRFMVDLFNNSDPALRGGGELTAREMLDYGAEQLHSSTVDDPEIQTHLRIGIGAAYMRMGRWQEARTHLEEGMALLRSASDTSVELRIEALTEYSNILEKASELVKAEEVARELVAVAREHRPKQLPVALATLGNSLSHQMKQAEAELVYREGISLLTGVQGASIPLQANLGIALFRQGKFEESHALANEVMQLIKTHWGETSPAIAAPFDTIGNLEIGRGNFAESIAAFEEAIRIASSMDEPSPNLAYHTCGLAEAYLRMRDAESAAGPLNTCAEIRAKTLQPDSFDALGLQQLQGMHDLLLGRIGDAERKFRHVLVTYEKTFGASHVTRAKSLRLLGTSLLSNGDLAGAHLHLSEALALWEELGLAEDQELAELALEAGTTALLDSRLAESEALLRRALRIREQLGVSPGLLAATRVRLAESLTSQNKLDEAEALVRSSIAEYSQRPPLVRGQHAEANLALARVLERRGQTTEGRALRQQARDDAMKVPPGGWRTWLLNA